MHMTRMQTCTGFRCISMFFFFFFLFLVKEKNHFTRSSLDKSRDVVKRNDSQAAKGRKVGK